MISRSRSLHVAALASIAVAQPLFDLLGRAPEFLLAHDLGPFEILAVIAILGVAVPLVCALPVFLIARVHKAIGRATATAVVSVLTMLVALYAARDISDNAWTVLSVAAVAGAFAGLVYHRTITARWFMTCLAPAIVIVPLVFLLRPGVQSLVRPREHQILQSSKSATPVVFVVFDGLPLTALLDEHQRIDRELYPSFAALADQSTWYRNATTVSDYTQWSVPAMLSGRYPSSHALPIASDHPETLFTLLGGSHSVKAQEPISRLCPPTLCDHVGESVRHKLMDFFGTLAVAYLHAILPERLQGKVPPIDDGWADGVPPSETAGEVWLQEGDQSRRGQAIAFINAIEADGPQPSLHFLHVLLPHIPLAYLPDGQRYGTERTLPGLLDTRDRWVPDEWAATQGYRRFLLQVGYVDMLLGQLVHRLKEVGLFDRALIVVTSDHGGSFRAGLPFRRLSDDTFVDVLPVPLLIKAPHQREGVTSDRNVETVDILPTVAQIMSINPPWKLDGLSAVGDAPPKKEKTVYHDSARRVRKFPESLRLEIAAAVHRKVQLFGSGGNRYLIPLASPHHELIGRAVDDLQVTDTSDDVEFALDLHGDFSSVDPDSRFLPAQLAGRARWRDSRGPAIVAVAVGGIVRATTRTYQFPERGADHAWSLVLPPDAFQAGENEVEVFMVRPSGPAVLHRTQFTHARPVDLLTNAAVYGMRASVEGVYERDRTNAPFRWTNGNARITIPREGRPVPGSLRISLATPGSVEKGVVIRVNGCELFEGRIPSTSWSRIFAVPQCGAHAEETVIQVRSGTHRDNASERDLGVAIERIDLLQQPWPPPAPLPETGRRSQIRLRGMKDGSTVERSGAITATVVNRSTSIWASLGDLDDENGAVRLGVLWFRRGRTDAPAAVQRIELPRALVPGDSVEVAFELVPAAANGKPLPPGEYEAWIGLLQEGVGWFYTSGDSVRKLRVVHDARP